MKFGSAARCCILAVVLLSAPALLAFANTATGAIREPRFLWGFVSPGADPSQLGKDGADDVGPPRAIRLDWTRRSGATLWRVEARWSECEPVRLPESATEKDFDWAKFDADMDSMPPGKAGHCSFSLDAAWAQKLSTTDEAQYWRLAERFIEFAARRARARGVRYYGVPGNETSLTWRSDWAELYMGPVRHFAAAIHRGNPDNQVIAGALVCGARDLIDALYQHGFKEHCDVLDIHAYAGTPGERRYNVGLGQILEAHQALVDHGDGHKRIFLGEGWSVFPLPAHLDKLKQPPTYSEQDIQHYRKAVVYGYAALTTPRPDYDPNWLLGATFFCLNDHWGSMGWKSRATIERDKDGRPAFWLLDGYKLPYEPGAMDPQFRAWGLIDIQGKAKGDIIQHFPPYIPRSKVTADLADEAQGPIFPGIPCRVRVSITNKETDPFDALRFSMDVFQGASLNEVEFRGLGADAAASLPASGTATRDFEVVAAPRLAGRELRVQGGCEFNWAGRPYYADGWLKLKIASPGTFEIGPHAAMASRSSQPVTLTFGLTDNTGCELPTALVIPAINELSVSQSCEVTGANSRRYSVVASKRDPSAGGFYTLEARAGSSFAPIRAEIAFPRPGRTPEAYPARGRLINPGFEEFGPGSGFEGWDGPPSNFDDREMAADLPNHGERMIARAYNGVKYPSENSQSVLVPESFRAGDKVTAAVWTKGVAFAGSADHAALQFRVSVVFVGADGKDIRREDSPLLSGTGKWERLEFPTTGAPAGTSSLRLILIHENTNHEGWHKAAMDNAELYLPT